jgi:hypothetical protein
MMLLSKKLLLRRNIYDAMKIIKDGSKPPRNLVPEPPVSSKVGNSSVLRRILDPRNSPKKPNTIIMKKGRITGFGEEKI